MMSSTQIIAFFVYLIPVLIICGYFNARRNQQQKKNQDILEENIQAGLTEPASLHPKIDPTHCIGCGSCANACPEKNVIGVVNGKAALLSPSNCIGHGACQRSCPVEAITLVFGTEKRGVEIPNLTPDFQTNVPGIYIAGELGGMGLVRNAIEQGKQAMSGIKKSLSSRDQAQYDVIIVGAGPSGIASSLSAKASKLNYLTLEQDSLGGAVAHFPRRKMVMTAPVDLPLVGKMNFRETTKENLLEFWQTIVKGEALNIHYQERLDNVTPKGKHFEIKTNKGSYTAKTVLLCLGRRGTPRKLNVPGEDQSKVVYRLIDAAEYKGMHVLVVGGGDSALEAALSLSEEPGTTVTLSYRSGSFSRAKPKNRQRIDDASAAKKINVLLTSNVKTIGKNDVVIDQEGTLHNIKNQAIIVCAGGILPTPFLKKIGIEVETKHGTA